MAKKSYISARGWVLDRKFDNKIKRLGNMLPSTSVIDDALPPICHPIWTIPLGMGSVVCGLATKEIGGTLVNITKGFIGHVTGTTQCCNIVRATMLYSIGMPILSQFMVVTAGGTLMGIFLIGVIVDENCENKDVKRIYDNPF